MFAALGRFVVGHRWLVIIGWLVAGVAVIGFAPSLTTTSDQAESLPGHYESIQAQRIQEEEFPTAFSPSAIVVFTREDGAALSQDDSRTVSEIGRALEQKGHDPVEKVVTAPPSPHRTVQTVLVSLSEDADASSRKEAVQDMRDDLAPLVRGTGLKTGVTGDAAIQLDPRKPPSAPTH